MSTAPAKVGATIAAIDLGSNSFHLAIARVLENNVQILHRVKTRVSLAAGMDDRGNIANAAMERGWECLAQFNQRLQESRIDQVRLVATFALRRAPNRLAFIERARQILDHPIEVISGREEARLIYTGVSRSTELPDDTLVIDIGGGSTELVIGNGPDPILLDSLNVGCVSYRDRFFPGGKISPKRFSRAVLTAQQRLEPLVERYHLQGWQRAIGCSGTIKTLQQIAEREFGQKELSLQSLERIREKMCLAGSVDDLGLEYLSETRVKVLPSGLAILLACFRALEIERMTFCDNALREGVIFEMAHSSPHMSVCQQTVESMQRMHFVDRGHASRVANTATYLFRQCPENSIKTPKEREQLEQLLHWSGLLHEVGLSLNTRQVQRHSGYVLEHSNMSGFNLEQQQLMAFLVRWHRKRIQDLTVPKLHLGKEEDFMTMAISLRLAVIWHLGRRHHVPLPRLHWGQRSMTIMVPAELINDDLLRADLAQESHYLTEQGWTLIRTGPDGQPLPKVIEG